MTLSILTAYDDRAKRASKTAGPGLLQHWRWHWRHLVHRGLP